MYFVWIGTVSCRKIRFGISIRKPFRFSIFNWWSTNCKYCHERSLKGIDCALKKRSVSGTILMDELIFVVYWTSICGIPRIIGTFRSVLKLRSQRYLMRYLTIWRSEWIMHFFNLCFFVWTEHVCKSFRTREYILYICNRNISAYRVTDGDRNEEFFMNRNSIGENFVVSLRKIGNVKVIDFSNQMYVSINWKTHGHVSFTFVSYWKNGYQ